MIVFRYLTGEVLKSQFAVFLILITIIVSQRFVKILADASEGEIAGQLVLTLVALKLPQLAMLILPLAAFLGVLIAYGRIYADSEMTVLHATGSSELKITAQTLLLSLLVMAMAAGLTLKLSPWASDREYQLLEKADADAGLATLIPGSFKYTSNGKAVVFVQDMSRDGTELSKVFLAQIPTDPKGTASVVYAQSGRVSEDSQGAQWLTLGNGRRYAGEISQPAYEITEFGRYEIQIREQQVEQRRRKLTSLSTAELWQQQSAEASAEWQWRLAIPLSVPLLMLAAVPLSRVNPRQGKFGRLLPSIALFLLYYILLIVCRSALQSEKIPVWLGLWWVHLAMLLFALGLLLQNTQFMLRLKARWSGRLAQHAVAARGDHA